MAALPCRRKAVCGCVHAGRGVQTPCRADDGAARQQYADVVPGFYSDKRTWNSVYLDGAVPEETLRAMCDMSYELVFAKLTKKAQREIKEK